MGSACRLLLAALTALSTAALALSPRPAAADEPSACRAMTAREWRQQVEAALRTAVEAYDPEAALPELRRLEQDLACLRSPIDQESLGRLFLYQGVVASVLASDAEDGAGRLAAEARTAFATGFSIFPLLSWDERLLGAVGRDAFAAVRDEVRSRPTDAVIAVPPASQALEVYVDGQPQGEGWDPEVSVRAGFHLVQLVYRDRRGVAENHVIRVEPGQRVTVTPRRPVEPVSKRKRTPSLAAARPFLIAAGVSVAAGAGMLLGSIAERHAAFEATGYGYYTAHRDANHALFIGSMAAFGAGAGLVIGGGIAAVQVRVDVALTPDIYYAGVTLPLR